MERNAWALHEIGWLDLIYLPESFKPKSTIERLAQLPRKQGPCTAFGPTTAHYPLTLNIRLDLFTNHLPNPAHFGPGLRLLHHAPAGHDREPKGRLKGSFPIEPWVQYLAKFCWALEVGLDPNEELLLGLGPVALEGPPAGDELKEEYTVAIDVAF
ncbi:integrase-type DNA-binding superfamily protein [Striga asiatica]|uniref:Integrase-type DNA-binding superfamily protein n=1 Tax=Striga asiatica TaxID=4170 RepID=A0A5A7QP66_STRAF|nr:integrase-type DNA-binding superfamily protein [Striga asiatica]